MQTVAIIQLIARYGIPAARDIYDIVAKHFASNDAPSTEMWDALLKTENESNAAFVKALTVTS